MTEITTPVATLDWHDLGMGSNKAFLRALKVLEEIAQRQQKELLELQHRIDVLEELYVLHGLPLPSTPNAGANTTMMQPAIDWIRVDTGSGWQKSYRHSPGYAAEE